MASILDRLDALAGRASNLKPLEARVKARHLAGHREMIARGTRPDGRPVAPLAPATLRARVGNGPPRAPRGTASRAFTACVITATGSGTRLAIRKHWPGSRIAEYLDHGTARMPARPMGLRPSDIAADRADLRRHVHGGAFTS